jgi:hypothetical protein
MIEKMLKVMAKKFLKLMVVTKPQRQVAYRKSSRTHENETIHNEKPHLYVYYIQSSENERQSQIWRNYNNLF